MKKYFHIREVENGWVISQTGPVSQNREAVALYAKDIADIFELWAKQFNDTECVMKLNDTERKGLIPF